MLTADEAFTVRDSAIRVREIEAERVKIQVGQISALDAIIEEAELARTLAPLCVKLLADNERLLRRVAKLEGHE
jgi:hypothetical protein